MNYNDSEDDELDIDNPNNQAIYIEVTELYIYILERRRRG